MSDLYIFFFLKLIGAVCRRFLSGPKQGIFCGLWKYLRYLECRGRNSAGQYLYWYETPTCIYIGINILKVCTLCVIMAMYIAFLASTMYFLYFCLCNFYLVIFATHGYDLYLLFFFIWIVVLIILFSDKVSICYSIV